VVVQGHTLVVVVLVVIEKARNTPLFLEPLTQLLWVVEEQEMPLLVSEEQMVLTQFSTRLHLLEVVRQVVQTQHKTEQMEVLAVVQGAAVLAAQEILLLFPRAKVTTAVAHLTEQAVEVAVRAVLEHQQPQRFLVLEV
jgi:hypothetical protein